MDLNMIKNDSKKYNTIAYEEDTDKILVIKCESDNFDEGILFDQYEYSSIAPQLLKLGDLNYLGAYIPRKSKDFDESHDVCIPLEGGECHRLFTAMEYENYIKSGNFHHNYLLVYRKYSWKWYRSKGKSVYFKKVSKYRHLNSFSKNNS